MRTIYGIFYQHVCGGGRGGSAHVLVHLYATKRAAKEHIKERQYRCGEIRPLTLWGSYQEHDQHDLKLEREQRIRRAEDDLRQAEKDKQRASRELRSLRIKGVKS